MGEPIKEGRDLIERWQHATEALARAKSQVNSAECELTNAINALGKWMLPPDAKKGEAFCIWWGDSMIQVVNNPQFGRGDFEMGII